MASRPLLRVLGRTFATSLCITPVLNVKCNNTAPKDDKPTKLQLSEIASDKLTFEYMIKQSALDSVNNVSKLLTVTYVALETTSKEYRDSLLTLINLTRETFMFDSGDEHWDEILNVRLDLQNKKRIVTELTLHMDHIHKLAIATTELCYSTGLDSLSNTLNGRIDDALNKLKTEVDLNTQLEAEYNDIQEQSISRKKRNSSNNNTQQNTGQ